MRAKRADGGVASRLLLFASTPQSNLRFAISLDRAPFGCGTSSNPKAFPACGESGTKCRKGNGSKKPSAVRYSPSVCSLSFTDSSPASGWSLLAVPQPKRAPLGLFSLLAYSPLFLSPAVAAARAGDKQANAGDIARGRGCATGIAGVIVAVRPAVAGGVAHGGGAG